ncbi:alpha-galactosidase [Paenibacillus anaericanus]|uniref:Alpha-galactosidase n=1 Tax=Paenibacillus anaericanus TaxID=170367 RepID=A0A3S1DTY4_9BACL|nr:glycoside hydrolase family 36 protein [Paenibacillus anaericanus]RUT45281.1 alpha-galactosidase [Paenibacillus anaericanus]
MSQNIKILENGIHLQFEVTNERDVRFLHFGAKPYNEVELWDDKRRSKLRLVEVHVSGENHDDHHGPKHTGTLPGKRLKLTEFEDSRNAIGRKLVFHQRDEEVTGLVIRSHFQLYDGIPVIRAWTEVENSGEEAVGLEYVSSFAYTGFSKEGVAERDRKIKLHIPHNTWYGEAQWQSNTLPELGLNTVNEFSMKRLSYSNTGTWSSSQYAPMAFMENTETGDGLIWQIEHNGSWHYEISDMTEVLYLQLSGPTENEHHWWKQLMPGDMFSTVTVAVSAVAGGLQKGIDAMTLYRREIRRANSDNEKLPVIFNDYMNCLFGDPTTEKLIPLIDAAAEVGCEYYCIDCGWYSDGYWWDGVGEWLPSEQRFPGGITEVLDYIRNQGMVPGLWLELEVMGVECKKASEVPDDWFFIRHGKRVIDHSRYQLDYRNPEVRAYANRVIDRLVQEYGVGYIKMDYNINGGIGTELQADSFGDGLLEHNRAYLSWMDGVFARYPELVIENCGSGGMRLDYAMLSRHSIQSSSDQTDYLKNAAIAAASASLVTPEQCAVWSYPLRDAVREEVVMNMINSLLLRIHQSGHLAEISPEGLAYVKEGITYYKSIREHIATGLPFWPNGMPRLEDPWLSYGIREDNRLFLAVWRMDGEPVNTFPLPEGIGRDVDIKLAYPSNGEVDWYWNRSAGSLSVSIPCRRAARLLEITLL